MNKLLSYLLYHWYHHHHHPKNKFCSLIVFQEIYAVELQLFRLIGTDLDNQISG